MKIWDRDGAVGYNKNYSFSPKFHQCDGCSNTPQFPIQYQSIQPIEKGILHFDFNADNSIPILSDDDRRFQNLLFKKNNFSFGFLDVPTKVTLTIQNNETEYFFCRRALIQVAFQTGLNLIEQMDYADTFYPLNKSLKNISTFRMNWVSGDPSDDKDNKVKLKEFSKFYGKNFTYYLSDSEVKDLRLRKANSFPSFKISK